MRIAGLWGDPLSNVRYRVELPLRALGERGHQTEVYSIEDAPLEALVERLRSVDVLLAWRLFNAPARRALRALHDAGVAIVWDNDDDLLNLPPGRVRQGRYSVARDQLVRELSSVVRMADAVTTTSEELARRFRRLGAPSVAIIDNYVPDESIRPAASAPGDAIVVGWLAGGEHKADLKQLRIRPALERVLAAHPHVQVVGVGLDLGLRSERYRWQPPVAFTELSEAIATFDVGIAPIANLSFNRGRSSIKLKEYAAVGVPWLASPIGPYRDLGEAEGGRLVPDPMWRQRVEELVSDDDARGRLASAAAAWGRTQTISEHAHRWEAILEDAHRRACARSGKPSPRAQQRSAPPAPMVVPRPSRAVSTVVDGATDGPASDAEPAGLLARIRRGRRGRRSAV